MNRLALLTALTMLAGCSELAIDSAPPKKANVTDTPLKDSSLADFWSAFHGARYDQAATVIDELSASYKENPNDPERSLPLALSHLWFIAESKRGPKAGSSITDHLIVAEKYFSESLRLTPNDYRILGWLGGTRQGVGTLNNDQRLVREGHFMAQDGIGLYPAFDGFVACTGANRLLRSDSHFQEAVDALWASLDGCTGTHVDRSNPDLTPFLAPDVKGFDPLCGWTDKAPHTFEGIMLQAGDILVKQGDTAAGKAFYASAQASPDYANWAFRSMLEDHLANIDARAAAFAQATSLDQEPEMVGNSIGACSSCHQK